MFGVYPAKGLCPICSTPAHVCGDSHMRRGPVDLPPGGDTTMQPQEPQELSEYVYVVNNMQTTALLTPQMAERLGAVPVGDDPKARMGGYTGEQNQAVYTATHMSAGVKGGEAVEPNRPQQMGIDEEGRTRSMLPPPDSGAQPNPEPDEDRMVAANEPNRQVPRAETPRAQNPSDADGDGDKANTDAPNKARRTSRDK